MNLKKGDVIELEISKYAFEGKGIGKIKLDENDESAYVVFVDKTYPGDKVKASYSRIKKSYAEARLEEILEKSVDRTEPKCTHFGVCGGCKQQDLKYEVQAEYKELQVKEIFEKMGGLKDFEFLPIVKANNVFFYRNKLEFSFSDKRWLTVEEINQSTEIDDKNFALGFHIPRMFDRILDIEKCWLQSEESNKILNFTRNFFKSRNTSIYSTKDHKGFLRHLVVKHSHHTNDLMVNIVTSEYNEDLMKEYSDEMIKEIPEITTIVNNINTKKAQVAYGDYEEVLYGSGFINDKIGKYKFRISPNSFFQTNTLQAEKLYNTALEFADFKEDEIVYDLYSGAGTIAIYVSEKVKSIYAFEHIPEAVADAKENMKLNNVSNISFFEADLNKSFQQKLIEDKIPHADTIIADPPRSGMNPKTIQDILFVNPKKVVYVSCNPTTQVRDIKLLVENGYRLIKIQPVDMFPHTFHIENVALLVKE